LAAAAAAATDGGLSFVLKKCYRSAGYWGGPARTSADRRAFAAVAAGGRPRTSGFADVTRHSSELRKNHREISVATKITRNKEFNNNRNKSITRNNYFVRRVIDNNEIFTV
jgi:hypothetical protein